ncbi:hypothetical protein QTO34_001782 [Cnephaeus nilssonii]|uniref:Uncharacterized protein n=1 Tax=Cnephaeus nilssonii TaxID=3371016 RepID=A0AA40HUI4_CNENI|nr:hypothetical protein QTO34_001782 [Eptesicus nilssonii]
MESSDEEDMEKHRIHLRPVALRTRCTSCPVKSGLTGPPLWGAFSPRPSVRVPMDSKGRSLRGEEVEVPPGLLGYMMNTDHAYVTNKDFMFSEDCPRPQVQDPGWKQNLASGIPASSFLCGGLAATMSGTFALPSSHRGSNG